MNGDSTERRRRAAISALESFASENGLDLNDCQLRETAGDDSVSLIYTAPDGREFGLGYKVAA